MTPVTGDNPFDGCQTDPFALIFVGGSIPRSAAAGPGGRMRGFQPSAPSNVPDEYKNRIGRITAEKTIPILRRFAEAGGTILALDSATALADHFELPLANALIEKAPDGTETPLRSEKFYVPGSILRVRVDTANPLALGMREHVDVFFRSSPVFDLSPEAVLQGVRPVAWFDSATPLRSGWAWGQHYLEDTIAVAEVPMGKGSLVLFGPEVAFRAQSHGAFKFLFNGIYHR